MQSMVGEVACRFGFGRCVGCPGGVEITTPEQAVEAVQAESDQEAFLHGSPSFTQFLRVRARIAAAEDLEQEYLAGGYIPPYCVKRDLLKADSYCGSVAVFST